MTLVVVGAEHGIVTIVADTKVTWDDDAIKSASVFEEALTKIVLLRDDLAVAVAGDFPDRVIHDVMKFRQRDVDDVLGALAADTRCDYVVTALNPVRIWRIVRGTVEDRDLCHRTSIGDAAAFSRFQQLYEGWIPTDPQAIKMRTAMDQLTSTLGAFPSVGGFSMTASSARGQFRFVEREFYVAGASPFDGYHGMQLPGTGATPGATGIYIPRARVGRVFRHEDPSTSVRILADTPELFAKGALEQAQQSLIYWTPGATFTS